MKKILSTIISVSMIAASAAVPVNANTETSKSTVTPMMTYVNYNESDSAIGYISTDHTAIAGYNSFSKGSIVFQNIDWGANYVTFLKVDASNITDTTIINAVLTIDVSGSTDSKRTCSYGAVNIADTSWDDTLTYSSANSGGLFSGTAVGTVVSTSTKKSSEFETKTINITDALKNDEDRVITIAIYETAAAGGYIKNPSVEVEHIDLNEYTVTYNINGTESSEIVYDGNSVMNIPDTSNPGYTFKGWSKNDNTEELYTSEAIADMAINGDTTFTAQYDVDSSYIDLTIIGSDSIKAGTSTTYTYKAEKNGTDVTDTIENIMWSVYDCDNATANENINISIENGTLTVADGVLPQTIYIFATNSDGTVTGSKSVEITWSDSQKEAVAYSNACEANRNDETERVKSIDGSYAYLTNATIDMWDVANQSGYSMTEMDIKFTKNGAGFTLQRRDGKKTNTEIYYNDGTIRTNKAVLMTGADTDTWYHVELLYSTSYAACNIYTYDENGKLGAQPAKYLDIDRRNAELFGRLNIGSGACVDNIIIYQPAANDISITAPNKNMFTGETMQLTPTLTRDGLPLSGTDGITWTALDEEDLPIIDGSVTVDSSGLLTVDSMAPAQTIKVVASTATGASDSVTINIQVSEIFKVTNIGINEARDKIVKLYVDKNFYYNDDVVFVIAIKDENGVLKGVKTIQTFGDRLSTGSNELNAELDIPSGFDPETWKIETMVWTMF